MRNLRPSLIIPIFLLPLVLFIFTGSSAPIPSGHADSGPVGSISPAVNANRSQIGGRISVGGDLPSSANLDWFSISFSYNRSIVHALAITYTTAVFGANVAIAQDD